MNIEYFHSYIQVDQYIRQQEFVKCEELLTKLINQNPDVTDTEKAAMTELFRKRIVVYHRLGKYKLALNDIESLTKRNVTLVYNDELFLIQQESIFNCALDEITENLNQSLSPCTQSFDFVLVVLLPTFSISANRSYFAWLIEFFDSIKSKDVFNE
ncbi:unnamed protein product [Adineta ricciae]|uniref:Uncharacterized protein n=1 Tax=Adineta ricciae TaxID=249248 RepID=A0A816D9K4_ADIRI|nr:unnamed protein product [Adineta ricciae]